MKKLILASAILAAFASQGVRAEEAAAPAAEAPEHAVAFNVGLASEYRYRGISQSQKDPALSAGADYTHNPSGFYAGTWLSTIKWIKATGAGATTPVSTTGPVEWDIYAGKRGEIGGGFTYDVGGLYYYYPKNDLKNVSGFANANTFELYGQIGYGPAYLKYSHSLTDTFGNAGTDGSYYIDAGVNYPINDTLILNAHVGHQTFNNISGYDYEDWKLGLTKDFGYVVGSIAYIGTNANKTNYTWNGTKVGTDTVVVSVVKNF